jgi:hypothetical protein
VQFKDADFVDCCSYCLFGGLGVSKKSHSTTWFGACSYRKLKIINGDDVGIQNKCPICNSEFVHIRYLGNSKLLLTRRGEVLSMFAEDGTPLWEVAHEGDCHGECG